MTIYELTNDYLELLMLAESEDLDPEAVADTLEGIAGEIEDKAENYAKVMKQMQADADGIKAEEERLHSRRTSIENNIKRMKEALQNAMEATGKEKFKTELFSFGIQSNPPSVAIAEDAVIPNRFYIPQEPKLDKKKLLEELKIGIEIDGCSITQGRSLRIR